MPPVAIVSDTTHYLPRELVAQHEIKIVSLYVNWDGRTDRESDLGDYDAYYEHLRIAPDLPTTSQPSVGDFIAAYEPLLADGRQIVSIHLSGGISGTVESARQAKAALEEDGKGGERIAVLDSQTTAGGQGMMVLAAAAAARRGGDRDEVARAAEAARAEIKIWFAIDTMEFLKRSGRVGAAQAWLGSTLRIKPILTLESEITPVERVRTSARAFERMGEYLKARCDDGADGWVIQHVQAHEEAQRLVTVGNEIFGCEPLFVSEVGPVLGTHIGPGMLGVGGLPRRHLS